MPRGHSIFNFPKWAETTEPRSRFQPQADFRKEREREREQFELELPSSFVLQRQILVHYVASCCSKRFSETWSETGVRNIGPKHRSETGVPNRVYLKVPVWDTLKKDRPIYWGASCRHFDSFETPTFDYQLDYQQKCWQWLWRSTLNYKQNVSQESVPSQTYCRTFTGNLQVCGWITSKNAGNDFEPL